jgi:hypothetical protein
MDRPPANAPNRFLLASSASGLAAPAPLDRIPARLIQEHYGPWWSSGVLGKSSSGKDSFSCIA